MKYIRYINEYIRNKKMIALGASALILCVVVAALVYLGLRMVAPKKSQTVSSGSSQTTTPSKEQLAKQAETLFQAGDNALKAGDAEKGITALRQAQKLYEQNGDTMKVEEIKDQIALAEQALKVQGGYKSTEMPEDKGKAAKAS